MTNDNVPQIHCDHECVCWWYYEHKKFGTASPCESEKCHHRFQFKEPIPLPNSSDLLLIAHDEYERWSEGDTGTGGAVMTESDKVERAVLVIAKAINEKTKRITHREDWGSEISDLVDTVAESIFEELELMWIDNGGSPP